MSTTITSQLNKSLELLSDKLGTQDTKILLLALVEITLKEIDTLDTFSQRIKEAYASLAAANSKSKSKKNTSASSANAGTFDFHPLKVINKVDYEITPGAAPDLNKLVTMYGMEQLPAALERYRKPRLLEAVSQIEKEYPSHKLAGKSKATIETIIAFLVEHAKNQ